ncbi:histidine phosphatase family protein [Frankia sp. AgB32]|uniref:histidine phosphatase family protein n=1 Tax=Frankia sp. AgB32 TaxID=631119 RepID=UPI00200D956D|nr:histidine phosphatase family protein [Frankia sp. AgB32]MCK9894199.1 histidine phosphatase family protein [Frankia sp. AgB32]
MLLRHGQTPYNVVGALDTARPGAELTALGQAQARALPGVLRGETISAIHASVLIRTQLTAAPLAEARGLTVGVEEGLEEIVAGDLELRSDRTSIMAYLAVAGAWIHGDLDRTMPGGQNGHEFVGRYDAAIAKIAAARGEQDTAVVVSHGAAIRAWVGIRVPGVGPVEDRWLSNTGLVTLEGDPSAGWTFLQWHSEPLGGTAHPGVTTHDVTGAPVAEATAENRAAH